MRTTYLLFGLMCLTGPVSSAAQPPAVPLATSRTLREALTTSNFDDALLSVGTTPEVDRDLTSSAFGTDGQSFVAAYYFVDELNGQILGPLRISRCERATRRWTHAPVSRSGERGSVLRVQVDGSSVLIERHASPSAGNGWLLAADDLHIVSSVYGFNLHLMPGGAIRFIGSMVHFAPTSKETLFIFDPASRKTVEGFPGVRASSIGDAFRREIRAGYARLPYSVRQKYELSAYGPIDDFDRSFQMIRERDDGGRVAFIAVYACHRCDVDMPIARKRAAVRCDRQQSGEWSCAEQELERVAADLGVLLVPAANGGYASENLEVVVRRMVARR